MFQQVLHLRFHSVRNHNVIIIHTDIYLTFGQLYTFIKTRGKPVILVITNQSYSFVFCCKFFSNFT